MPPAPRRQSSPPGYKPLYSKAGIFYNEPPLWIYVSLASAASPRSEGALVVCNSAAAVPCLNIHETQILFETTLRPFNGAPMNTLPKRLNDGFTIKNRYQIEAFLGIQDMGFLYRGRDLGTGKAWIRIRVFSAGGLGSGMTGSAGSEFSLLRRLRHPNLVRILDFGLLENTDALYLAEEWIDGKDIYSVTEYMDAETVLGYILDLAKALRYLHARGIVHGCLNPSNTILSANGDLKLLDFGLTRFLPVLLPAGGLGRLAYMAPEVLMGEIAAESSDLYSLGILIYQLLTRRLPFGDEDPGLLVQKHLQVSVDFRPIERLRGGNELSEMLCGLLEKKSSNRFPSCEGVIRLLTKVLGREYPGAEVRELENFFSASRFVGREKELLRLQQCVTRVRTSGRGWTVFVAGEGGSGKTRLFEEIANHALLQGWHVIEGACGAHEEGPYGPYRQILAKTEPMNGESVFRFEEGPRAKEPGYFESSPEFAAGQFRDQLTRELVRRLRERPSLLLLHDFHLADEATCAVLDYLSSDIQAHSVLMCVSLRPGEEAKGLNRVMELTARQERGEILSLEPLTEGEVGQLVAGLMGDNRLKDTLGKWMFKSIGGNPFFLEEMLKHLVEQGLLHYARDQWRFRNQDLLKLEVPDTIGAVLHRRLIQLSPFGREVVGWMALFVRPVSKNLLAAVSARSAAEVEASLAELKERQLIRIEMKGAEEVAELCHVLIAEVIRGDLTKPQRRRMHRKIAEVLERECGAEGHLQELAIHSMEGRVGAAAVRYALALASHSHAEFAHEKALPCFQYVFTHRGDLTEDELCLAAIEASDTMFALGMPKQAIRLLKSEMMKIKGVQTDTRARMFMQLALCYQHLGNFQMQEVCCKNGLSLFRRIRHSKANITVSRLWAELAFGAILKSRPKLGLGFLDKAIGACPDPGEGILAGRIQTLAASLHRVACNLDAALAAADNAVYILRHCEESYLSCSAQSTLGSILASLGRFPFANEKHNLAASLSDKSRSVILRSQALGNMAECLCRMGHIQEALDTAERAAEFVSESSNPAIAYAFNTILAEVRLAAGDYGGAINVIDQLKGNPIHDLALYASGHAHYVAANARFLLGDFNAALEHVGKLKRLGTQEAPLYESELAEALKARILFERGQSVKAIKQLYALLDKVTRKHWPYQMCIIKLHLADILLDRTPHSPSEKLARDALRLAKGMQSISLTGQSHFVLGRIHSMSYASTGQETYLDTAVNQLQSASSIINSSIPNDTLWRVHAELCFLFARLSDRDRSLDHGEKALTYLGRLESQVPRGMLSDFRNALDRARLRSELTNVIQLGAAHSRNSRGFVSEIQDYDNSRILLRVSAAVNSILDLNQLLEGILDQLIAAVGIERAFVLLKDESTGKLRLAKGRNHRQESLLGTEFTKADIFDEVCRQGSPVVSANAQGDPRLNRDFAVSPRSGKFMCAPLKVSGRILGVLYGDHHLPAESLSEAVVNLFAAFCNLAAVAIDNALAHQKLVREKSELEEYLHQARDRYAEIIGKSDVVEALRDRIGLAAGSPLDILIIGESGTGKELVAKAIHRTGRRKTAKFVALDCGSLSDTLAEAELFGYRKGAFTGAVENRPGLLESAHGGIIFLDEVSNMPLHLQAKLLRVLQEREVRRIGETAPRKIDVQVIAATNKDLLEEMREGRFRNDLYYRLKKMEIRVPALRDRSGDIPLLLEWFLDGIVQAEGGRQKKFSQEAKQLLESYEYPGNIRELQSIVARSYYSAKGIVLDVDELPPEVHPTDQAKFNQEAGSAARLYAKMAEGSGNFEELIRKPFLNHQLSVSMVRGVIERALKDSGGNYRDAFSRLNIPDREYSLTLRFLKRYTCFVDYRPFRRKQTG
jgi:Nif-specific regulatory protein